MKNVAVIGAGAAGLMAAYAAAKNGNKVTVFEKNEKCGKKIYITGKGRCNLTHDCDEQEFLQNVVSNPKFMTGAIYNLSPEKTMHFFEEGGLKLKTERGARVFPLSDKASDVTKCLENYCKNAGVSFKFNEKVLKIDILHSTLSNIITEKCTYNFDCAIVCTGGISYPLTGSTGDGYKFAEATGHNIIPLKQGLCGLNLKGSFYKSLQGLSLKNVFLTVYNGDKVVKNFFGEMLFTHFGVSGPIILSASSLINRLDLSKIRLVVDLKPALSDEQLDKRVLRDFEEYKNKNILNCLKELLPIALIPEILKRSNIDGEKKVNSVTKAERAALLTNIKNFDMFVSSLRGFDEAIVTCGGVDVKQIDPKTMESKLIKGLYFCGEVLDLDAFTGGFNLQIAFSTGFAAGNSIKD
ncbi:MAG: NAD(P)/FAD-dependent oxidoreductase [Clostridiales bacterium]|nr:NAD(P)/FAD-dependent oxidoreductase [Clostridiales bacterium]